MKFAGAPVWELSVTDVVSASLVVFSCKCALTAVYGPPRVSQIEDSHALVHQTFHIHNLLQIGRRR